MDNSIGFLVVAFLTIGGIFWFVMYTRKQGQKHTMQTSIRVADEEQRDLMC